MAVSASIADRPSRRRLRSSLVARWAAGPGDEAPTYERDIGPLFARRCTVCHSRKNLDNADVSAGLALDSYEAVLAGTREHKVITPGKAAASALFERLNDPDEERRMPLGEKPLSEPQRALVGRWIDAGAPRGIAPAASSTASGPAGRAADRAVARRRRCRSTTKVPAEVVEGVGAGGAIRLVLKVGPLPAVSSLAFRGDGRQLAVGTFGAVVVWDLEEGKPALILDDVPGQVHALAFSHDGTRLAVGAGLPARSGSVRVYSVPDGTLIHDFEGHDDVVFGLALRPDGAQLASVSFDQSVRLWDLALDRPDGVFRGHSDFVYDVAYTRDGRSLLSASKDRSIKRIDVKTLKERRTYSDHNEDVMALAVQPEGSRFVSAGVEPQLRWWAIDGEKPAKKVGGHTGPVHQLAFSEDGKRLISAGGDGTVRLWDGTTGAVQRTLPGTTEWQYAAALSDDAHHAAAGGWDGLVRVWDADAGLLRATLLQPPAAGPTPHGDWLAARPEGYLAALRAARPLGSAGRSAAPAELPSQRLRRALFVEARGARPGPPQGEATARDLVRVPNAN